MKRDITMFILGAVVASAIIHFTSNPKAELVSSKTSLITTHDTQLDKQTQHEKQRVVASDQANEVQGVDDINEATYPDADNNQSAEKQLDKTKVARSKNLQAVKLTDEEKAIVNQDPQIAFDAEEIDYSIKEQKEAELWQSLNQEKWVDLNITVEAIECKSARCRIDVIPYNGNSNHFPLMQVMQTFAAEPWFGDQAINFQGPDENGVRTLYLIPGENFDFNITSK